MIIKIKNLSLETVIGVYGWEKNKPRTLIFNVEIETDFIEGIKSDHLKDTIDYDIVVNQIKYFVDKKIYYKHKQESVSQTVPPSWNTVLSQNRE